MKTMSEAECAAARPRVEVYVKTHAGDCLLIGTIPSTEAISINWLKEHSLHPSKVLSWYWSPTMETWIIRVKKETFEALCAPAPAPKRALKEETPQ